jgi:SAM-dependent methyltransferase
LRALWPRSAPGRITDEWLRRNAFLTLDHVTRAGYPVNGRDVAEVGVGDSLASGLAFLAAGARTYTAADPYLGAVASARNREVYRRVKHAWVFDRGQSWPETLDVESFPASNATAIRSPIEDVRGSECFDLICSASVVEHVWNLTNFAAAMHRLLRRDGIALHWVDLGPHDRWAAYPDKLTFLRVPEPIWRTGRRRGLPSRTRLSAIAATFGAADLDVEVAEIGVLAPELLPPNAARLASRFRSLDETDLVECNALLRLRRTAPSSND